MVHSCRSARSRGQALPELLVAIVISLVILSVGTGVIQALNGGLAQQISIQQDVQTVQDLEEALRLAAASAASIYTPPSCGGATASGDGAACATVRFYNVDASGASHIWGFDYSAGTKSVTECLTYTNAYSSTCLRTGRLFANVVAFAADPMSATTIAGSIPSLASYSVANVEPEIAGSTVDPSGRIVAGNRVMAVTLSTVRSDREVDLLPAGTPVKLTVLVGAFTPPQLGTLTGPSPINLYVGQTLPVSYIENNYGQYAAYVSGGNPWTLSGCTSTSGSALPIALASLTGNSGDSAGVSIVGSSAGSCTFNVASADQTESVTVNVYEHPAYQLTTNPTGPATIDPGATTGFTATTTLKNPNQAPPGTPSSIPVTATSTNADCGVTNSGTQEPSGTSYTVSGNASGACDIDVVDTNGDQSQVLVTVAPPAGGSGNGGGNNGGSGSGGSGAGATPDPVGTYAAGGPFPTATSTPLLGPCGNPNGFGDPTNAFVEPQKPASPAMSAFYQAVSAAGPNKETPNGNVVYGYEDHFQGYTKDGEKGAFLMAENIDCSVTMILTTETFTESYIDGTYAFEWRNVPNSYSVDLASSLGGNDQGLCWGWGHNPNFFPAEPSPSCGTHGQRVDSNPPADLVSFEPVIDAVFLPFYKNPNPLGAARWVMHPDPRLRTLPVPWIGHYVNSFNMNFDYFPEVQGTLGLDGSSGATYMGGIPNIGAFPNSTSGLTRTTPMTPHP